MKFRSNQPIWRVSALLLALLMPVLAQAQASVIFERVDINIESSAADDKDKEPRSSHPILKYSVESRPEDALRLEYIHTLNDLSADTGVLITFEAPSVVPLPAMKVYTPVDALFVADDGTVVQILPNVVLGDITQEIKARVPVKGFLFIKAGEAAARAIHPHDTVSGKMFAVAPPVQQ